MRGHRIFIYAGRAAPQRGFMAGKCAALAGLSTRPNSAFLRYVPRDWPAIFLRGENVSAMRIDAPVGGKVDRTNAAFLPVNHRGLRKTATRNPAVSKETNLSVIF